MHKLFVERNKRSPVMWWHYATKRGTAHFLPVLLGKQRPADPMGPVPGWLRAHLNDGTPVWVGTLLPEIYGVEEVKTHLRRIKLEIDPRDLPKLRRHAFKAWRRMFK